VKSIGEALAKKRRRKRRKRKQKETKGEERAEKGKYLERRTSS